MTIPNSSAITGSRHPYAYASDHGHILPVGKGNEARKMRLPIETRHASTIGRHTSTLDRCGLCTHLQPYRRRDEVPPRAGGHSRERYPDTGRTEPGRSEIPMLNVKPWVYLSVLRAVSNSLDKKNDSRTGNRTRARRMGSVYATTTSFAKPTLASKSLTPLGILMMVETPSSLR